MNVAVIGATGVVGRKLVELMDSTNLKTDKIYLFASEKSEGKVFEVRGEKLKVEKLTEEAVLSKHIDIAFFVAGGAVSKKYVPILLKADAYVIDNSSVFRLFNGVPLVVPYVNAAELTRGKITDIGKSYHQTELTRGIEKYIAKRKLIANPNCSTIQLVPILHALKSFGIKRVVVTTFQACSGAGMQGINDLKNGMSGEKPKKFEVPIFSNIIAKIGEYDEEGYSEEENKIISESRKILHDKNLNISATAVRVPTFNCHAESVNITFEKSFTTKEITEKLKRAERIKVYPKMVCPTLLDVDGKTEIAVGRIRRDESVKNGIWLFNAADNLIIGAALNALLIAEAMQTA